MKRTDELLEERLARLEAGEPLEQCVAGLPQEEAELVRLAAELRALPALPRPRDIVQAERRALLESAQENTVMTKRRSSLRTSSSLPAALGGVAALTVASAVVVVVIAGAGLVWRQLQPPMVNRGAATGTPVTVVSAATPGSAALNDRHGLVEVQSAQGVWSAARSGQLVTAGQRVRTGALSAVTLTFFDASQARLGPNTEVALDELDARTDGPRVVALTQMVGETDHIVTSSDDPASRYEVATPSGVGVAQGTTFHVLVTATLVVRFDVDEGAVAVSNLDVTVIVVAGQSTTIVSGQPPEDPVFRMSGEGQVTAMGDVWIIAGQTLTTNTETVVLGDPTVGDRVSFQARILPDGTLIADRIELIQPATSDTFAFAGTVEELGQAQWVVLGITVEVNETTSTDEGLSIGSRVKVEGRVLADGAWLAEEIRLLPDDEALRFELTGVVEGTDPWVVAGISLATDADTEITDDAAEGDTVRVEGRIRDDGAWLAEEIKLVESASPDCVSTTSVVQSVADGQIILMDGQTLELAEAAEVQGEIAVASVVLVESCTRGDEQVVSIRITILYQLEELPPTPEPGTSGERMTICHRTGKGQVTLTVSQDALPAHLAHGDTLGACP